MLWLIASTSLVPQNVWRYIRDASLTDVVISGFDCIRNTERRNIFK